MQVFNVICQVIFYSCLAFSIVMLIYYKIRKHLDMKKKLAEVQQQEIDKEISKDEERQDTDKE